MSSGSSSVSVCIATYKRPTQLAACLDALMRQTEPPDDIVISDAGGDAGTREVIDAYRRRQEALIVHCPTPRAALPWQRWWAFEHCGGARVLFLDDDIRLAPQAMALLRQAYRREPDIAGAGFTITYDGANAHANGSTPAPTLRTRWLGISGARPGSVTRGGITVDLPATQGADGFDPIDVEWLSGGAMSFRREVLEMIGPLAGLFALYDARIGKAEDAVLSTRARGHGRLLLIPGPHAAHPALDRATRTANPQDGFRRGLLETWGRAHTLRWLADNPTHAARAWRRIASLEVARACKSMDWYRLAGDAVGIQRTIRQWDRMPTRPDRPSHVASVMLFWDYDTQWGADRSRLPGPRDWGHLEFPNTDELLELHARFAVPACFAVVGAAALPGTRPYHDPAQIRRIHAAGHEIASHAFKHEWLPALDRRALLRTLRESKDALEQCIGASVVSFVPPFNQPFDFARAGSISLAERREAGGQRTTLRGLCDALAETGYQFCRVAYAPIGERVGRLVGRAPLRPVAPVTIAGITCVRIGACGFDLDRLNAMCQRAANGAPIVLYGHPHSLHATDTTQSIGALHRVLDAIAALTRAGAMRCVLPAQLHS